MYNTFRQLGFSGGTRTYGSYFGVVPSTMAMDNVGCVGTESYLRSCPHSTADNCGPDEGAGVICT